VPLFKNCWQDAYLYQSAVGGKVDRVARLLDTRKIVMHAVLENGSTALPTCIPQNDINIMKMFLR